MFILTHFTAKFILFSYKKIEILRYFFDFNENQRKFVYFLFVCLNLLLILVVYEMFASINFKFFSSSLSRKIVDRYDDLFIIFQILKIYPSNLYRKSSYLFIGIVCGFFLLDFFFQFLYFAQFFLYDFPLLNFVSVIKTTIR